ncbi:MAG: hypothetical protein ACJAT7_001779 [Psychromonas sp.]|jgi:hypothetical protein|uniref:Dabb family protein n=1 Tax=Psychromonas sp. TaxID=1884585 RepID=UPI0039E2E6AF
MIRHLLLVRFKADATADSLQRLQAAFMEMPNNVQGLAAVEWGENNSPENKNKGYTHCIMMTFSDHLARDNYLPDPAHSALKILFRPLIDDIVVLDYSF